MARWESEAVKSYPYATVLPEANLNERGSPRRKARNMKIKVIEKSYAEVMKQREKKKKHIKPKKPSIFFRTLMKLVAAPDLKSARFTSEKIGMEKLGRGESALYLMNHSSFIDLEIVAQLLYPRPFNIITTSDGFIGKNWLMRQIGCIPTNKFVTDTTLVRDILYAVRKKKSSIVLFPEAGYSFDGTSTTLPNTTAGLIKLLGIPVVMIHAYGAFSRDPLYNNLQKRAVSVHATEKYTLSAEDVKKMSVEEIDAVVEEAFSFDNFEWQNENRVRIDEPFRADGLNRVLYKCPHCLTEGKMLGSGITIGCTVCKETYVLNEYGHLDYVGAADDSADIPSERAVEDASGRASAGKFTRIPDWYRWERECAKEELLSGKYSVDLPVDIFMTVDTKRLYRVGEGRLRHSRDGFLLESDDRAISYEQKPTASYTVNSDFNWYELGDMISIGNNTHLFYCFPKTKEDIVAKMRLSAEELYKIVKQESDERRAARKKESAESLTDVN